MKRIFLILMACVFLSACDNKPDAPFGFKWGQSIEDVKKLDLPGFEVDEYGSGLSIASAQSAPSDVYDAGHFGLTFMQPVGLMRIIMLSETVDKDDFNFNDGKALYQKISSMLEEKYALPKKITEKVDKDGDKFYFCLQDESCGVWKREYEKDNVKVTLEVSPTHGQLINGIGKAHIVLTYEYLTDKMKSQIKAAIEGVARKEEKKSKENVY
ncbi:hypothetical protein CBW53_03015 [Yersinia frederiksenii]|nr:hypothetical protein CBW53_03015 [Yersinia frederiksenii]